VPQLSFPESRTESCFFADAAGTENVSVTGVVPALTVRDANGTLFFRPTLTVTVAGSDAVKDTRTVRAFGLVTLRGASRREHETNVAATGWDGGRTTHGAVPEQAPVQPTKRLPGCSGCAVRITLSTAVAEH
jgi:hypothetical protein